MSQTMVVPSIEFMLVAGRAVALLVGFGVLAWAFSQWRRAAVSDTQRVFEQLDLVRTDLLIMKEAMNHATGRSERPQHEARLPAAAPVSNGRGYEIAVRMARSGASKEELMRTCGITNHEAELLIKLHRRDSQPAQEMIGRQVRQMGMSSLGTAIGTAANAMQTNQRPSASATTATNTITGTTGSPPKSDSVDHRFDRDFDQAAVRAALTQAALTQDAPRPRAQKSRLMAIG